MSALHLNIHGVELELGGDTRALAELAVQFAVFAQPRSANPSVRVELRRETPSVAELGRLRASQVVDRGLVYNDGPVTLVDHHGYATSRFDFARQSGVVTAPEIDDLVELGYLMVHARLGPLLEQRGLVRAHAVGAHRDGRTALVLTPSGGGKSRLALALLGHPDVQLLSDDVVLLDRRGNALPFPMPIGVASPELAAHLGPTRPFPRRRHGLKHVVELEGIRDRFVDGPTRVELVVVAHRVSGAPSRVTSATRGDLLGALWRDVVVGLGLPQVIELVARGGAKDLWRQTPAIARRSAAVMALVARARAAALEIYDPESAAAALLEAL